MHKKITISIITLILFSTLLSPIALSSEITEEIKSTGEDRVNGFTSESVIYVEYDKDAAEEIIWPIDGTHEIPLDVSYYIRGPLSSWHELIFAKKSVDVKLEIIDKPEWCEAYLDINTFTFGVKPNCSEPKNATLSISLNEKAPAFVTSSIKIKATSDSIKGLIFTKVAKGNYTLDVPFTSGYVPLIEVDVNEEIMVQKIPPLKTTIIPINITNLGNGKTDVFFKVTGDSSKYTCYIPSKIVLDSPLSGGENKKQIEFTITPYKNFTSETISIRFTPVYSFDPLLQGQVEQIVLELENDGSLKDENDFKIDTTLLVVTIAVIALVIVAMILFKRKK